MICPRLDSESAQELGYSWCLALFPALNTSTVSQETFYNISICTYTAEAPKLYQAPYRHAVLAPKGLVSLTTIFISCEKTEERSQSFCCKTYQCFLNLKDPSQCNRLPNELAIQLYGTCPLCGTFDRLFSPFISTNLFHLNSAFILGAIFF